MEDGGESFKRRGKGFFEAYFSNQRIKEAIGLANLLCKNRSSWSFWGIQMGHSGAVMGVDGVNGVDARAMELKGVESRGLEASGSLSCFLFPRVTRH